MLQGQLVSRLHARIEYTRNRFLITDQSTNGTFVVPKGQEQAFVRRDSLPLSGNGRIGLGSTPDPESSQTLRFSCEES